MQSKTALQQTPLDSVEYGIETLREATAPQQFTAQYLPLEQVTHPNLTTAETAYYLNRRPQTLRGGACHSGTGPMVPTRVGGLLAWSTATVKKLAGVPA
jgi:hypothetical protein